MTDTSDNTQRSSKELVEKDALEYFTEYFVQNYPGPNTIISRPTWHAPKIFKAVVWALQQARKDHGITDTPAPETPEQLTDDSIQVGGTLFPAGTRLSVVLGRINLRVTTAKATVCTCQGNSHESAFSSGYTPDPKCPVHAANGRAGT